MKRLLLGSVFFCLCSVLNAVNPALEKELYILRDPSTDRPHFRASMRKVGEYLALDIAKDLDTKSATITTITQGQATHEVVDEQILLVTIMRAGLPMIDGFLDVFPEAEVGFYAIKRDEKTLDSTVYYEGMPAVEGKTVILVDPMIATGGSMCHAIEHLSKSHPKKIIVVGAFVVKEGLQAIRKTRPGVSIYTAVVDPKLNDVGYICPGLGDAGDRAFGVKVD